MIIFYGDEFKRNLSAMIHCGGHVGTAYKDPATKAHLQSRLLTSFAKLQEEYFLKELLGLLCIKDILMHPGETFRHSHLPPATKKK